jgi:hypothetical protein
MSGEHWMDWERKARRDLRWSLAIGITGMATAIASIVLNLVSR